RQKCYTVHRMTPHRISCRACAKGATMLACGAWLGLWSLTAWATELHVATTGKDDNAGDAAHPFLTVNHAAQVAQPGDTVTVHAGTYRERVDPARGGTAAQPIVYRAADGEAVAIKGSEPITTWKQGTGMVWSVTLPNTFFGTFNPYTTT